MTASATSAVKFIGDEPARELFFETHRELARAIATAIRTNQHLRVIGLLGRWGSGKSTVIQQLEEELTGRHASDQSIVFFNYDAWLNQSDPQRRAFLETLVKFLIKRSLVPEKEWLTELKQLAGRVEDSETVENPTFSAEAKWFALSLIPIGVLLPLLGLDFFEAAFGSATTKAGIWARWLMFTAAALPILCWLVINLIREHKGHAMTFLPPLFSGEARTRTYVHTEKSPDPTSIEFGRSFRRLMRSTAAHKKRLIIVVDNIDRVSGEDALSLWANIRNMFLSAHEIDDGEDERHPTIILPFDDHVIGTTFSDDNDPQVRNQITESFLDKTFDATFFVPEPVLSDWKDFADKQIRFALGDIVGDQEVFWGIRFIEQKLSDRPFQITPRYINRTVNKIAALYLHRGSEVSLLSIFFWVINRDLDGNMLALVFSGQPPILAQVERDWQRQIAALHYGVDPIKAGQILIEAPLKEAIESGAAEEFGALAEIPGFGGVFDNVTRAYATNAAIASFRPIVNAARLLSGRADDEGHWRTESWRNLCKALLQVMPLVPIGRGLIEDLKPFWDHIEPDLISALRAGTIALYRRTYEDDTVDTDYVSVLDEIANTVRTLDAGSPQSAWEIPVRTSARIFFMCWSETSQTTSWVRTELTSEEMDAGLDELIKEDGWGQAVPRIVRMLQDPENAAVFSGVAPDWERFKILCSDGIRQYENLDWLHASVEALVELASVDGGAEVVLDGLVDEGHMIGRYQQAVVDEHADVLPFFAAPMLGRQVAFDPPSGGDWRAFVRKSPEFVSKILDVLWKLRRKKVIYNLADSYRAHSQMRPLIESIVGVMLDRGTLGVLSSKLIAEKYYHYSIMAPWGRSQDFARVLAGYERFWENLESASWGQGLNELASSLVARPEADANRAREILRSRLISASREDWDNSVRLGEGPFEIVFGVLSGSLLNFGANSALSDVLVSTIGSLLSTSDRAVRARWFSHLVLLSGHQRGRVLQTLIDSVTNSGGVPKLHELAIAGGEDWVRAIKKYSDKAKLVQEIVIPLTRHEKGRMWLRDHRSLVKGIVASSDSETKKSLGKRLAQLARSEVPDQKAYAALAEADWKL